MDYQIPLYQKYLRDRDEAERLYRAGRITLAQKATRTIRSLLARLDEMEKEEEEAKGEQCPK